MLQVIDRADALQLGIFHDQIIDEGLMHRDVDVFVDRRRDQKAALLAIVGGQVGAAAAERDPKGRAHDDHGRYLPVDLFDDREIGDRIRDVAAGPAAIIDRGDEIVQTRHPQDWSCPG